MQRRSLIVIALSLLALGSSAEARSLRGLEPVSHVHSPVKLVSPDPRDRPRPETPPAKIARVMFEHRVVHHYWKPSRHRPSRIERSVSRHHQIQSRPRHQI